MAALVFLKIATATKKLPPKALGKIGWTAVTLTLLLSAYLLFLEPNSSLVLRFNNTQAVTLGLTYLGVAAFAALFFEEKLFARVIWRVATIELWLSLLVAVVSISAHVVILVNPAYGGLRLVGTLSEPSAWAPVIPLVLLLALRKRSWLYVVLALIGGVMTESPTCLVVLLLSVPLYYALTGTLKYRIMILIVLMVLIPASSYYLQSGSYNGYLTAKNPIEVSVGRLASGIQNVQTNGAEGTNSRYKSALWAITEVRSQGWLMKGVGPAGDVYYPTTPTSGVYVFDPALNLWSNVLLDFGLIGLLILAVGWFSAIWRMRHARQMAAILVPFFIASLVNSAEGYFEYNFVILGIMLFGLKWAMRTKAEASDGLVRQSPIEGLSRMRW